MAKDFTFYRLSKNKNWYRVHYENIKVGDIIRWYDKKWDYLECTGKSNDGLIYGIIYKGMKNG